MPKVHDDNKPVDLMRYFPKEILPTIIGRMIEQRTKHRRKKITMLFMGSNGIMPAYREHNYYKFIDYIETTFAVKATMR